MPSLFRCAEHSKPHSSSHEQNPTTTVVHVTCNNTQRLNSQRSNHKSDIRAKAIGLCSSHVWSAHAWKALRRHNSICTIPHAHSCVQQSRMHSTRQHSPAMQLRRHAGAYAGSLTHDRAADTAAQQQCQTQLPTIAMRPHAPPLACCP